MDGLLTNKYFTVAILVSLALLIYLYTRQSCYSLEGMKNLNYTDLGRELNDPEKERPWTDNIRGSKYGKANKDKKLISKLEKKGYRIVKNDTNNLSTDSLSMPKARSRFSGFPQPMDMRPDLSQCQPCNCDNK